MLSLLYRSLLLMHWSLARHGIYVYIYSIMFISVLEIHFVMSHCSVLRMFTSIPVHCVDFVSLYQSEAFVEMFFQIMK